MGIFYHLPTPRRGAHREDDIMILNLKNLTVSSFPFTLSGPPITGCEGIKGQESLWLNNTFCSRWLLSKGNHTPYQKGQTAVGSWIGKIIWIEIRTQCSALIDTDHWKLRTTACVYFRVTQLPAALLVLQIPCALLCSVEELLVSIFLPSRTFKSYSATGLASLLDSVSIPFQGVQGQHWLMTSLYFSRSPLIVHWNSMHKFGSSAPSLWHTNNAMG